MFWNIGVTAKQETRVFVLSVVILSGMLLPAFPLHPALPSLRLDEFIIFLCTGLNLGWLVLHRLHIPAECKLPGQAKILRPIYILFAAFILSYAVSNLYARTFLSASFTLRDVMELVTYGKYFLILTLVCSLRLDKENLRFLAGCSLSGLALLMLLGWGQHLNFLGMNTWLSPFFDQDHWEHLIVGNPARILGTFDNPNEFGLFTVLALSLLVIHYFFVEKDGRFPWLTFVLIGLVIKLEYLTISRTALMGIALLFACASLWALRHYSWQKPVLFKVALLLLLTLLLFFTASSDFLNRIAEGLDFSASTSFLGHVARWESAIGSIWDSPVFGWGTQKGVMTTLVDNEYALYTRRYGFIGLAVYLAFYILPCVLLSKHKRWERGQTFNAADCLTAAFLCVLPSVLLYNFMAGIFYNLQMMTIFTTMLGLTFACIRDSGAVTEVRDT